MTTNTSSYAWDDNATRSCAGSSEQTMEPSLTGGGGAITEDEEMGQSSSSLHLVSSLAHEDAVSSSSSSSSVSSFLAEETSASSSSSVTPRIIRLPSPHQQQQPQQQQQQPPLPSLGHEEQEEAVYYRYADTCRLVTRLGVAAMRYGLTSRGVEVWMQHLLQHFGYDGQFVVTCQEIFGTFSQTTCDDAVGGTPHTALVPCQDGINLHKLAQLSELAVNVKKQSLSPQQAEVQLQAIHDDVPTPWTLAQRTASFVGLGAGVAALLGGNGHDVVAGATCSVLSFALTLAFAHYLSPQWQQWLTLVASFVCYTVATILQRAVWPACSMNVTLVTLSGIWYFVPGYGITLATAELVEGKKILSGVSRFMKASVTLLWLVTGSWLADRVLRPTAWLSTTACSNEPTAWSAPISPLWLILVFIPALLVSVSIVLNNAVRDVPWAVLCMGVALLTTWGSTVLLSGDDVVATSGGIWVGSTLMTVYANVWSKVMQRPNTLVLVPAYLFQASGSIGYLGLLRIVSPDDDGSGEDDRNAGIANVLQMFTVALLITAGVFAGNTLVPSYQLM